MHQSEFFTSSMTLIYNKEKFLASPENWKLAVFMLDTIKHHVAYFRAYL